MSKVHNATLPLLLLACLAQIEGLHAGPTQAKNTHEQLADGTLIKKVLDLTYAGENLLKPDAWRPWQEGFQRQADLFICDNASDAQVQRGASQTVTLNQTRPEPIIAVAFSKAEGVGGSRNSDYSLYLDLTYTDGTPLWGQTYAFNVGTHDWEKAKVIIFPEKPVRLVHFHMLLRRHSGKAWFRNPELRVIRPPAGACLFDGVPVSLTDSSKEGFQVRDVGLVVLRHVRNGHPRTVQVRSRKAANLRESVIQGK